MCQLTLLRTNNIRLTKAILASLLVENTRYFHKDGCGIKFFNEQEEEWNTVKSLVPPIDNPALLDEFVRPITVAGKPILAHVRKASTLVKDQVEDHLHPFFDEETGLTLAHNGTLEFLDEKKQKEVEEKYPGMIDSQIFFSFLIEFYKEKKGNLVEALQETMKLFCGKFAFLIKDAENNFYAVRGRTADLHLAQIYYKEKIIGVIVNTELTTMRRALDPTLWAISSTLKSGEYSYKDFVLDKETIYKVDGYGVEKLGEIEQNTKPVKKYTSPGTRGASLQPAQSIQTAKSASTSQAATSTNPEAMVYKSIMRLTEELCLTIYELDELFMHTIGKPLCMLTSTDLRDFNLIYYKVLMKLLDERKTALKDKRKSWNRSIRNSDVFTPMVLYAMEATPEDLQFPFFLTNQKILHDFELYWRRVDKKRN